MTRIRTPYWVVLNHHQTWYFGRTESTEQERTKHFSPKQSIYPSLANLHRAIVQAMTLIAL